MKLKIDYNLCIDKVIGNNGISLDNILHLSNQAKIIHNKIQEDIASNRVGFYNLPFADNSLIKEKVSKFQKLFSTCVVLGIGGSALGTIAVYQALSNNFSNNKLFVIDNIDPDLFYDLLNKINFQDTFFTIISKSGSTAETISQFLIIRKILIDKFGEDNYKKHLLIITDPSNGELRKVVEDEKIDNLSIPENVGGRFSVLSPVGLFPLAFAGVDIDFLLEGAIYCHNILNSNNEILSNPAYLLGVLHYLAYNRGKNINIIMPYSSKLSSFVDWFRQLWAESLGKNGLGATPVKAIGATDQHSLLQLFMEGPNDKIIGFIKVLNFNNDILIPEQNITGEYDYLMNHSLGELLNKELDATRIALAKNGIMNYNITIDEINPFVIGQLIFLFQVMTHFTGYLFEINPFNQPGVELSKKYTYGIMGRKGFEKEKDDFQDFLNKQDENFIV